MLEKNVENGSSRKNCTSMDDSTKQDLPAEIEDDGDVSDLPSDLDLEETLAVYIDTKAKLYQIDPTLAGGAPNHRNNRRPSHQGTQDITLPRKATKLQQKIKQIEADPLFDQKDADTKWANRKAQLAKDLAAKRKSQSGSTQKSSSQSEDSREPPKVDIDPKRGDEDGGTSEEENGLGDLFASVPSDDLPKQVASSTNEEETADLVIRDFGQSKGVEPRRILDETCRARWVCPDLN